MDLVGVDHDLRAVGTPADAGRFEHLDFFGQPLGG
jgi:hypothetical protein